MKHIEPIAGRYVPVERVGSGGMGVVFRARDSVDNKDVAIKVIRDDRPELERRFQREVEILRSLDDEGIVGYRDHGKTNAGRTFLVMDWVEGPTLREVIEESGLTADETKTVIARVAHGLETAHRAGLVHRDVKPSNIVLRDGDFERAILIDFGLARFGDASNGLTTSGVTLGTPGYMAPEQVLGRSELDGRTDSFALGCVLYECLTGIAPFYGLHRTAMLAKVVLSQPIPIDSLADIPEPLAELIGSMLAKAVADRPSCADAAQKLGELEPIGTAIRVRAREAPTPEPAQPTAGDSSACLAIAAPAGSQALVLPKDAGATLIDGTAVLVASGSANATTAAKWALEVSRLNPDASVALVTEATDSPSQTAIDRAAANLLGDSLADALAQTEAAIVVDQVTASRLPAPFKTTLIGSRLVLSRD